MLAMIPLALITTFAITYYFGYLKMDLFPVIYDKEL